MLTELHVADLGIVSDLTLVVGPGLTAITGETGTGKTLLVEALELLVGGRADTTLVRDGASEARVEGRFVDQDTSTEIVLARVVPLDGRSRAYVDGRLAAVGELAEVGARLVDLHGQHAHQSLLAQAMQRGARGLVPRGRGTRTRHGGSGGGRVGASRSVRRARRAAPRRAGRARRDRARAARRPRHRRGRSAAPRAAPSAAAAPARADPKVRRDPGRRARLRRGSPPAPRRAREL